MLALAYAVNVSQAPLLTLLRDAGVQISAGQVSRLLTEDQERWHAEAAAVADTALREIPWQEFDDTTTRVNGQNQYCQVLTSPLATIYHTTPGRLTVLDVLRDGRPRTFLLNVEADHLLAAADLSLRTRLGLAFLPATRSSLSRCSTGCWPSTSRPSDCSKASGSGRRSPSRPTTPRSSSRSCSCC